jgi:hypothetical protein
MDIHNFYDPFIRHFRKRRAAFFYRVAGIREETRILDLGGTPFFWNLANDCGLPTPQVTIVNLWEYTKPLPANIKWVVADGTHLPFPDKSFDVVFSNSVIEHLGTWDMQFRMACEIRRLASRYFVQTPDRRFPVECHFVAPFVHWFPIVLQRRLLKNFTIFGWITRPTQAQCDQMLAEIRLLNHLEMRKLFPGAKIVSERLCGIPKSLIAVGDVQDTKTTAKCNANLEYQ